MSKASRTRGLIIVAVLFAVVIVLGFFSSLNDRPEYELSTSETLDLLQTSLDFLSLEEARGLANTRQAEFTFIDLRSPDLFAKGHVEGAENIPLYRMLEPAVLERLEEERMTFVLYGADDFEGAKAWALLQQLGITQTRPLQGSYDSYATGAASTKAEAARYNFREVFERVGTEERGNRMAPTPLTAPKKVILPKKRVAKPVSEGC